MAGGRRPWVRFVVATVALLLAAVVGIVAAAGRAALSQGEDRLREHGVQWASRRTSWDGIRWTQVEREGASVHEVHLDWWGTPCLHLHGAEVDAAAFVALGAGAGTGRGGASWLRCADVDDLSVDFHGLELVHAMSGRLLPAPSLSGTDAWLIVRDGALDGRVPIDLNTDQVQAKGYVTVSGPPEQVGVALRLERLRLQDSRLPVLDGSAYADMILGAGKIDWTGNVVGLPNEGHFVVGEGATVQGAVELGPVDLAVLAKMFEVPEAATAEIVGKLGATVQVSGPPWVVHVEPRVVEVLGVEGALPDPDAVLVGPVSYSVDGSHGTFLRQTPPHWTSLADAGWLPAAVIAAEDSQFMTHHGYDLAGIRAGLEEWSGGDDRPRGGSTLTQQLAKNLYTDGSRTMQRKARELLLTLDLERTLSKDRILELYLNVVQFGPDRWGIEQAASAYFDRRPKDLAPREAALIAAVLPAPNTSYASIAAGDIPRGRVSLILQNMADGGALSHADADSESKAPITVRMRSGTPR